MDEPKPHQKKGLLVFSVCLMSLLVLVFGYSYFSIDAPSKQTLKEVSSDFSLMAEAWNTIQQVYVDRSALKPRDMTYGAIGGMVDSLGDLGHSSFLTPDMIKEEREFTQGQYKGVGLELRYEKGHAVIIAPLDGSPAQRAGLRSGQVITKVDGKNLLGLDLTHIVKLILGEAGTKVTLTIFDPASDTSRDVVLIRAAIHVENIRWKRLPGTSIAHLRIAALSGGVTGALRKALREIREQGNTGIVLDLRDDPGGLLDEAIGSASQFLEKGYVLQEKDAAGKVTQVPVEKGGAAPKIPLVVLVNEGTASAAEIIAGAIQDAGRGKLVGKTTFGTGTVLQQFNLSDGSALLLAVEEWLTPHGHSIWHKGITPDLDVDLPQGVLPLLPDEEAGLIGATLRSSRDAQLLTAIRLLSGGRK